MHPVIRFLILLIFGFVLPLAVAIIIVDTFYLDLAWMILIWGVTTILAVWALRKFDRAGTFRK